MDGLAMPERDRAEGDPGQNRGNEQKPGRHHFGETDGSFRLRARLGGSVGMVIIVIMMMIMMIVGVMRMVLMRMCRVIGGAPGGDRDARPMRQDRGKPGQNKAQERQKYDRLIHETDQPFIVLMSSTAIEPRLR